MIRQPTILDALPEPRTLADRFERWFEQNGHIYALFRRFAEQALGKGLKRFSADAILHRIRWEVTVESVAVNPEDTVFKVNNDYASRLARRLIADDPRFSGFFELRQLKAKGE